MKSLDNIQEALLALDRRIERLTELSALYEEGELSLGLLQEAVDLAVIEHEADREIFASLYAMALGPLDLDRYGQAQEGLEKNLSLLVVYREQLTQGTLDLATYQRALAAVEVYWQVYEPWREEIRREIETDPHFIENERKEALVSAGWALPFAVRKKHRRTPEEKLDRAYRMIAEALQEKRNPYDEE